MLQERRFERVGGTKTLESDVRWIAATNRDLATEMLEGRFRADLYHRLAVFPVRMPTLRERREDILPLAQALLTRIARNLGRPRIELTPTAQQWLPQQPWPGNVRELANALERAAILAGNGLLDIPHLSIHPTANSPAAAHENHPRTLEELEREAIEAALLRCAGHRRKAAEELGIGLRTLYEKLKRYGMG